jgi:hypothetical protein
MKHRRIALTMQSTIWFVILLCVILKLKLLVTEETCRTEQKYKVEKEVGNFCNVFVGSNYSTTQFPFFENVPGSESSTSGRRYTRLIFYYF